MAGGLGEGGCERLYSAMLYFAHKLISDGNEHSEEMGIRLLAEENATYATCKFLTLQKKLPHIFFKQYY